MCIHMFICISELFHKGNIDVMAVTNTNYLYEAA